MGWLLDYSILYKVALLDQKLLVVDQKLLVSSYKCRVIVRHHRCAWFLGVAWLAWQGFLLSMMFPLIRMC